jgi:hypothetical protein
MSESVYMSKPWLKSYEKGVPEFVKYQDVTLGISGSFGAGFCRPTGPAVSGDKRLFQAVEGDGGSFFRLPR